MATWMKYIECIMNGFPLRKCADMCNIHYVTAFKWRHKVLDALKTMSDSVQLSGIVEVDETFERISYKGNHSHSASFSMPGTAHKRGGAVHKRGLSSDQVCVPCAVNRDGLSLAKAAGVGKASRKSIRYVPDGRIAENSVFVTDGLNLYPKFAKDNGLQHVAMKPGKHTKGIYGIQHINSYHSGLKNFLRGFKGVSTKYLDNYLRWNNFVNYARETYIEKVKILSEYVFTQHQTIKDTDISNRPALPVAA